MELKWAVQQRAELEPVAVQWIGNRTLEVKSPEYSTCRKCSWNVSQRLEPALVFHSTYIWPEDQSSYICAERNRSGCALVLR